MRIMPFLLFLSFISASEAKLKIAIDFEGVLAKRVPIRSLNNYPANDIVKGNNVHMYIRPETADVLGKILDSDEIELVIVNSDHRIDNPDIVDFISNFKINSKSLKDFPVSVYKVADLDKGIDLSKIESDLSKIIYLKDSSDKVQMTSIANTMTVGPFDFAFKDFKSHEYVRKQIGSKFPNSFVKDQHEFDLSQNRWRLTHKSLLEIYKEYLRGKSIRSLGVDKIQFDHNDLNQAPNESFAVIYKWDQKGDEFVCSRESRDTGEIFSEGEAELCYGNEQKNYLKLADQISQELIEVNKCMDIVVPKVADAKDLNKRLKEFLADVKSEASTLADPSYTVSALVRNYKADMQDILDQCKNIADAKGIAFSNDHYFQKLLRKPYHQITLDELLTLWFPQDRKKLKRNYFDHCGRKNGNPHEVRNNYVIESCAPDTLYRWSDDLYLGLMKAAMPDGGNWAQRPSGGRTIYTFLSPAVTHGYGPIAFRFKIKPGVKFTTTSQHHSSCGFWNQTSADTEIYYNNWGGLDVDICSPAGVVESWSYNTRELYDEIVKDWQWNQRYSHSQSLVYWHAHLNEDLSGRIDGHSFGADVMKSRLYGMAKAILAGDGGVFTPSGEDAKKDRHYKTGKAYYANEE